MSYNISCSRLLLLPLWLLSYFFQLTVFLLCSTPKLILETFLMLNKIKESGPIVEKLAVYAIETFYTHLFFVVSSILFDLINVDLQRIKILIVEKRMKTKNTKHRIEVEKLFQFVKSQTIECTLWRVLSLNVRNILSFVSFAVTTIIAVLQIKNNNIY
uniref:Uncharacterized protein n=1 Tax=Bombyx mori TaxID=7091 RepID=A0A8R2G8E1_BOMMO|nr:uncharacterized protein LOC105841364 [Bombyx mori]